MLKEPFTFLFHRKLRHDVHESPLSAASPSACPRPSRVNPGGIREIKFLVEDHVGDRARAWARVHLRPDPHGGGQEHDEYAISSTYCDTNARDVFHRAGAHGRVKYRVRRYGAADWVFLERKLRLGTAVFKDRSTIHVRELPRLSEREEQARWMGGWFRDRVLARELSPVCVVCYDRLARVTHDGASGRLTLDRGLRAQACRSWRSEGSGDGVALLQGQQILELKFKQHLPSVFKRLIEELRLGDRTTSKYRVAMSALEGLELGS